ncbi:GNAT family N-acetyltransferase [Coraliomargarita sp. SDUM461004]|uniref:GNAT family N-acetyltransferase n=1 Tax=Thalassobacterium sedimentorum TaxID=3041258 RepID=A0ABU1AEQ9_9BACT|nr:GNAT family N-acetyltransferase [Coraliomargarita sp. SDUM461004]MDQ8193246.1 GNAT family N-acetyltransferase [Coraliomargarita sp. SDUM461004]
METYQVTHLANKSRFEIRIGTLVAKLEYQITNGNMTIHHTFVPTELRGQKLAEKLAAAALEFARQSRLKVVPQCSYIEAYIRRNHPQSGQIIS